MGTPAPAIDINDLFEFAPGGQTNNETQEDSEEMWTTYMEEVKEHDKLITDAWKEDSNALVVFTGLFAAVVAAFIIESYKKLSPDTGSQTVVLLDQISQQLAGSATGKIPTAAATRPSSSGALMVCVNAMWLMSLVFSIASALFATMLQQWARVYIQMPQRPRNSNHRARVRLFLYRGTQKYRMRQVVMIPPTLLHLSVFLFFVGLVIFFFSIHKTVAIIVSLSVGLFGLAYLTLTILPCIRRNCPYRTPMTVLFWYAGHTSLVSAALFLRWVVGLLHGMLVPSNLGEISNLQISFFFWFQFLEGAIEKHWDSLKDALKVGLENSTIKKAVNSMVDEDHKMLTWLCSLLAIADKSTLRKFVASFPRNQIAQLMTPHVESGQMALRGPLIALLRSGAVRTRAVGLDEDMRQRSLLVCLDGVCHVAGALIVPNGVTQSQAWDLAHDVRTNFANISLMRAMWSDGDAAIRVTSRSICAFLAQYLMRRGQLEGPELAWLQDVTGETPHAILNSLGDFAALNHMNLKSFVYGVLSPQAGELPTENAASFTKTLAILMDAGLQPPYDRTRFNAGLVNFIQRVENEDDPRGPFATNKLGQMYQSILQP